jgi:hypothetical protein
MKTLLPLERISSVGRLPKLAAIVVAASVSCLPLSALANHTGGGGGGHAGGGGGHSSGGSRGGSSHPAASYHASGSSYHVNGSRTAYSGSGRSGGTHSYHANLYARNAGSSHVSNHHETTATVHRETSTTQRHDATVTRAADTSHTLSRTNKAGDAKNTSRLTDPARTNKAEALRARTPFDHSLTASSAHNLMSQRLNQISNRGWSAHGAVFANHSDPGHGYWYNHGGGWWRCNYWGANGYCDHLIGLGFAPGLCWAWYDDICWGNIVVGMPLDLVDYYYPDPAYSDYSTYDGDEATVYYYATDDGQYKQVTVVDGNVVDVEIVDQIS